MDLKSLSLEALTALAIEKRAAFDTAVSTFSDTTVTPTDEQIASATELSNELDEIAAEITAREEAASKAKTAAAALAAKFSSESEVEVEPEVEPEPEVVPEVEAAVAPEDEADGGADDDEENPDGTKKTAAKSKTVAELAAKVSRPNPPKESSMISMTAASNVPDFPASSKIDDMSHLAQAIIKRSAGFTPPTGDGLSENLQKFGVAAIKIDFPEELTIKRGTDDMSVLLAAQKESRLDGGSLVAAGGWCAPSETLYDLCVGETLDGLVSLPEVNVARGGINYTSGPSFADFYGATGPGFVQTEAQAIAGTAKTCVEVECPDFTEVRLDAIGLCIKVPILTNSAYPELIERFATGSIIAHQHQINADVIARMEAASNANRTPTNGLGATVTDTLEALELLADEKREKYRLGFNDTLEVVVPFWVKGAYRADLSRRTGQFEPVTDQQLLAHFKARNLNVQFVYDWQLLGQTALEYAATYRVLMYKAGTFIKGTSDVINISAVYDAASLAVNTYTGLFMEQGLLVARMCWDADRITLPICNAGRTGAQDLTCV